MSDAQRAMCPERHIETPRPDEGGFVLIILLTAIIPLIAMAAAAAITLGGRNERLLQEVHQERALLAAEAGIDAAIYAAKTGMLVDGYPILRDMGQSMRFEVAPTYLQTDGLDNDGDALLDSADPDEDLFQVVVTGHYRNVHRRVVAYLGPVAVLPTPEAAIGLQGAANDLTIGAGASIRGHDTKLDTTPGLAANDLHGFSIAPPETSGALLTQLDTTEQALVVGVGTAPSITVATAAVDIPKLVTELAAVATSTITPATYTDADFGTGILSVTGDLVMLGASIGAGVLVVDGNLTLDGTSRINGVVIVTGTLQLESSARIFGAVFSAGTIVRVNGTASILFSTEGLQIAHAVSREYSKVKGWQEVVR